ncbi:hypothetical protein D3C73_1438750 [compost metagenome]
MCVDQHDGPQLLQWPLLHQNVHPRAHLYVRLRALHHALHHVRVRHHLQLLTA